MIRLLDLLFLTLFGFAIFLCTLVVYDREEFAWPVLSFVVWIVLAICVNSIETQYAFLNSDNTIITSTSEYAGGAFVMWFFLGIALVFMMILINRVLAVWRRAK